MPQFIINRDIQFVISALAKLLNANLLSEDMLVINFISKPVQLTLTNDFELNYGYSWNNMRLMHSFLVNNLYLLFKCKK